MIHRRLLGEASLLNAYWRRSGRTKELLDGGDIEGVWQRYALTAAWGLWRPGPASADAARDAVRGGAPSRSKTSEPSGPEGPGAVDAELYWSVAVPGPAGVLETAWQWLSAGLPARNTDPIVWRAVRPPPATPLDNLGLMNRRGLIASRCGRRRSTRPLEHERVPADGLGAAGPPTPPRRTHEPLDAPCGRERHGVRLGRDEHPGVRPLHVVAPMAQQGDAGRERTTARRTRAGSAGMGGWTQRVDEPSVVSVQGG